MMRLRTLTAQNAEAAKLLARDAHHQTITLGRPVEWSHIMDAVQLVIAQEFAATDCPGYYRVSTLSTFHPGVACGMSSNDLSQHVMVVPTGTKDVTTPLQSASRITTYHRLWEAPSVGQIVNDDRASATVQLFAQLLTKQLEHDFGLVTTVSLNGS